MPEDFKAGFLKTLWIIRDYLSVIVIGGGWVPLIYYHYLLADKSREPIRTRDIDLMVKPKLPVIGSKTVDQLLVEAGFRPNFKGRETPPVICYEGIIDGHEVEIEFLTDQRGAKEDVVIEVQEGLSAQSLRFISIPLNNVIEVEIDDIPLGDGSPPLKVKIPSPGAYIFHKGLVFVRRKRQQKKAKDLYYIFDILANCPELRERIIKELKELKKSFPLNWFRRFIKNLEDNFSNLTSDGIMLVRSQRPACAFPNLYDDQFKQYVLGAFEEFIGEIKSF
jgi:hypothetical protein